MWMRSGPWRKAGLRFKKNKNAKKAQSQVDAKHLS